MRKKGGLAALSEAEQQDERARRKRADFTDGLDLIVVRFVILSCAENRNGFTPSLGLYLYRTQIAVGVVITIATTGLVIATWNSSGRIPSVNEIHISSQTNTSAEFIINGSSFSHVDLPSLAPTSTYPMPSAAPAESFGDEMNTSEITPSPTSPLYSNLLYQEHSATPSNVPSFESTFRSIRPSLSPSAFVTESFEQFPTFPPSPGVTKRDDIKPESIKLPTSVPSTAPSKLLDDDQVKDTNTKKDSGAFEEADEEEGDLSTEDLLKLLGGGS